MTANRFDSKKLLKLNNPKRLQDIPVDILWEWLKPADGDVFVDIGAGTAFFSIAFLSHGHCSTVYACDVSDAMIEWMQENVVPEHPEIIPVKTDGDTIPLGDSNADVVFMINLYHELDDVMELFNEAFRLLKSGGKLLVVDWKKIEMTEGPPLHIRHHPQTVEKRMIEAGFNSTASTTELEKHFIVSGVKD